MKRNGYRTIRGVPWVVLLCVVAPPPVMAGQRGDRDEWQQPARVVADLALKPGAVVADIGCCGGYFTFRLGQIGGSRQMGAPIHGCAWLAATRVPIPDALIRRYGE